jgi:hypothetical protein
LRGKTTPRKAPTRTRHLARILLDACETIHAIGHVGSCLPLSASPVGCQQEPPSPSGGDTPNGNTRGGQVKPLRPHRTHRKERRCPTRRRSPRATPKPKQEICRDHPLVLTEMVTTACAHGDRVLCYSIDRLGRCDRYMCTEIVSPRFHWKLPM